MLHSIVTPKLFFYNEDNPPIARKIAADYKLGGNDKAFMPWRGADPYGLYEKQ